MGGTRFMVQWEEHPSHLATRLGQLLEHQTLVDVTLMCNTHTLRVHRAVLAACSPYFETILQRQLGMYPLIVLKDMQFSVLKSLIEFMYCGETSVTEDNLSALLQAAKFFQVKGLSAMTKEALGLTSTTPKTTTINGDSARKAFVGRSKRVGMQQTFVASGLKTLSSTTHAASSHAHGHGGDMHTPTTGKTIFHTTPKSVPLRQDIHHQQQQQTDTAQLLLSLSGSEFPKQTFHTVSKNVRFHHGVSSSGAVTVEPSRSCPLDTSVVKNKETAAKSEVIDRVPVVTPNGGVKPASVILPAQLADKGIEQPAIPEKVEAVKDDLTSQMFFVEEGSCKRGRPLKRQVNFVFQEKVLTDAEMALQKEAEASRKALEMLQQEMSTGDETGSGVTQSSECIQQKIVPVEQPLSKGQTPQPLNNIGTTTPRILPKESLGSTKLVAAKTNIVSQATSVNTLETGSQNVVYQVAGNAIPAIDSGSNETNIVYQLQEGVIAGQDSSSTTNIVYQVADNAVVSGQDSSSQNIIYQVTDSASTSAEGGNNTNIIYQVADNNAGSGSAMTQYMEVLKEAGLPSDVPILLESSDGSYVTVNEEVLMNIMNGGMIQVGDGSIVGGEGVQFIVQEVQEVTEGQVETPVALAEQLVSEEMNITDNVPVGQMQAAEANDSMVETKSAVTETETDLVQPSAHKSFKEQVTESSGKEKAKGVLSLEEREPVDIELAAPQNENAAAVACSDNPVQYEVNRLLMEGSGVVTNNTSLEIDDNGTICQSAAEPPSHSDEIITGDNYGEEAMEGFAVKESKENTQKTRMLYSLPHTTDFTFPGQACGNEAENRSFPACESGMGDGEKVADIPTDGGLSVEQALQAMMGEGSDTEMEVCANTDADGTTKVRPIISHRDTKGHSTPNECSVDEETEDLRLVLSPEDESVKVEDESQSAGEGSLNDSFTLALSSPDSTGNDKAQLGAKNLAESVGGSQVESKPVEFESDVQTQIEQAGTVGIKDPCKSTLASVLKSSDSDGVDILHTEVVAVETSERSKPVESNVSETGEQTAEAIPNETGRIPVEMNNLISLHSDSDVVAETDSPTPTLSTAIHDKTQESSGSDGISEDKSYGVIEATEVLTPETNLTCPIVENDKVSGNVSSDEILPETDNPSNISLCQNVVKITSSETALTETEATACGPTSDTEFENRNAENSLSVSTRDLSGVGKSLPIISCMDSNVGTESKEAVCKANSGKKLVDSSRSATEADVLETELKNDADSEVPAAAVLQSFVQDPVQQGVTGNVLAVEQGKEAQDIQLSKEATELSLISVKEVEGREIIEVSGCESDQEKKSDEEGKTACESSDAKDVLVENQENTELTLSSVSTDENDLQTGLSTGENAVSSPSKDIPYAVGLLPLKTALEKLQAMPEYHPRKTRSALSGRESGSEVPASRLKRKASSAADSLEKKMKPCDADDGDGSYDSEGTMAVVAEDFDETGDENTLLETCVAEDSGNTVLKSPSPEECMETVAADNKMEPLPSMMELVSDSGDTV